MQNNADNKPIQMWYTQSAHLVIDFWRLAKYILKRIWLVIILAVIGFSVMFCYVTYMQKDTYAASATMYVYNGNPNIVNYQYVNSNDLSTAVKLLDTYMVVVKSNKVLDSVAERLSTDYPGITNEYISSTLSMSSVNDTGVLRVTSTTTDANLSAAICNAVLDVAPSEIIRVVGAGSVEIIDYAEVPVSPVFRGPMKKGILGAIAGAVVACGLLLLLFQLNQQVADSKELGLRYTPPVLADINRNKKEGWDPGDYILGPNSPRDTYERYAKLRMNLLCSLSDDDSHIIEVTSSISSEGKSTIAANLAISCAASMDSVLLIDGDMRRGSQSQICKYANDTPGLSEVLTQKKKWKNCLITTGVKNLDILPAGVIPPNPTELLSSLEMGDLINELKTQYKLILIDMPPINIVSDPLVISDLVEGCIFVTRQNFSDHREIRKALIAAEMTKMNVLGFVFYGEKVDSSSYYVKRYYNKYYNIYDNTLKENARKSKTAEGNRDVHDER